MGTPRMGARYGYTPTLTEELDRQARIKREAYDRGYADAIDAVLTELKRTTFHRQHTETLRFLKRLFGL